MKKYDKIQYKMRYFINYTMRSNPTLKEIQPLLYCALLCGALSTDEYNEYIRLCASSQNKI